MRGTGVADRVKSCLGELDKVWAMAFTWRYENAAGVEVEPVVPIEGEPWIGENWPELLAAEVEQVTLLEDGAVVYGPMSLQEAPPA
jgi:hypothetical protein